MPLGFSLVDVEGPGAVCDSGQTSTALEEEEEEKGGQTVVFML